MRFMLSNERVDSFKEYFLRKIKKNLNFTEFYALRSISLTINKGERIGIIGHNGAGKSTLLKIISGVIKPTEGAVTVNGDIAPLLELGAGFDPELTGAENIFLNGAILGKSKEYLKSRFDEIVAFSELDQFIHTQVKNYSSGMRARLGFSIAAHTDPDILILDEILGVGDESFQRKSYEKIKDMIMSGKTVILVSHSLDQVQELTDKVIWLEKGTIKEIGTPQEVCQKYRKFYQQ